jgi:acyl-CoA:6-aminopenicillanic acid acyl transferase
MLRTNMPILAEEISRRSFARLIFVGGPAALLAQANLALPGKMARVETRGDAFSRGKQQGEAFRDKFAPWMKRLLVERSKRFGTSSQAELHKKKVERWRDYMEAAYPEGIQECRGIVAGLDVDDASYFAVHFGPDLPSTLLQCTVVGLRDPKGSPLVGKTDDIAKWELGMNVLESTWPEKGFRHVHFHFAGTIWTVAGMNERGLAMGMNGIPAPVLDAPGMSSLAALHTILPKCATVAEAIEHIRGLRVNAGGFSLLLGDANGALGLVEKTGLGTVVLPEQKKGAFAHANGILDPAFAKRNPPQGDPIRTNSQQRYDNVLRHLDTGASMEQVLCDRSPRGAICQRGENGMYTDFAVVFAPVEKKFRFWSGSAGPESGEVVEVERIFTRT